MIDESTPPANVVALPRSKKNEWPIFISYRRSEVTRKIALWLKEELERDTVESTTGQHFSLDVFVDIAEPHKSDFQANLVPHLEHSRALILLADESAVVRKAKNEIDYLYEELDWWAEKRRKTPPIILQLDSKSGLRLVADSKYQSWRKVNFMDCPWEKWAGEPDAGEAERAQLLSKLRESIRNYGQVIHLEEVLRLKRRALISITFGILALIGASFAGWMSYRADIAKNSAEQALSAGFIRTIGVSEKSETSADEVEALWELSTLDRASQNVRKIVLRCWEETPNLFHRAIANNSRGLHAALGFDPEVAAEFKSRTRETIERYEKSLEKDTYALDQLRLSQLTKAIATLSTEVSSTDVARAAWRLAKAAANDQYVHQDYRSSCAHALAALAARMNPEEATRLVTPTAFVLVKEIEEQSDGPGVPTTLAQALVALTPYLNPDTAANLARRSAVHLVGEMEQMEKAKGRDSGPFDLARVLAQLAARMNTNDVTTIVAPQSEALAEALEHPGGNVSYSLDDVSDALSALAKPLSPNDARHVAESLAMALQTTPKKKYRQTLCLAKSLVAFSAGMNTNSASALVIPGVLALVKEIESAPNDSPKFGELHDLDGALANLITILVPYDAAIVATNLAKAMDNMPTMDLERLNRMAVTLASLAARMDVTSSVALVTPVAKSLANAVGNTQGNDGAQKIELARAVRHLVGWLTIKDAAIVSAPLVRQLEAEMNGSTPDLSIIINLGSTVAAIPGSTVANQRILIAAALMVAKDIEKKGLENPTGLIGDAHVLAFLPSQAHKARLLSVSILLREMEISFGYAGEAKADHLKYMAHLYTLLSKEELVEVLKWPFCVGDDQRLVLAELERKLKEHFTPVSAPKFSGNFSKFVEQAEKLGFNSEFLERPPIRPQITNVIAELNAIQTQASETH